MTLVLMGILGVPQGTLKWGGGLSTVPQPVTVQP